MVKKNNDGPGKKKGKIQKLKLKKDTVKDLSDTDAAKVKGGAIVERRSQQCFTRQRC